MRLKGSAEVLEARRQRAVQMLADELSLNEIARRIGCNASSVMRWRDRWEVLGKEGLKVRFSSGRPPKMNVQQKNELLLLLLQGPMAFGWRTEVWTTQRIATLIHRKFSIDYHFTQSHEFFMPWTGVRKSLKNVPWSATRRLSRSGKPLTGRG